MKNLGVSELLNNRSQFIQLVVIATLMSVGASLFAAGISIMVAADWKVLLGVGALSIVVGALCIGNFVLMKQGKAKAFKGIFLVDKENKNEVVEVDGYRFSEKFVSAMRGLFAPPKYHGYSNA